MSPGLKQKSVLLLGGNWVSRGVNECWRSLSGLGSVSAETLKTASVLVPTFSVSMALDPV